MTSEDIKHQFIIIITGTMRLIRDGVCGGGGGGGIIYLSLHCIWGGLYTYRYTVTTRMTSQLRRAAMRAVLMFHGQSHKSVPQLSFEDRIRTDVPLLTSLTPLLLGQSDSLAHSLFYLFAQCPQMLKSINY